MNPNHRGILWASRAITVASFAYLGHIFYRQWHSIQQYLGFDLAVNLFPSIAVYSVYNLLGAVVWIQLLKREKNYPGWVPCTQIYGTSLVAKYLPGNLGVFIGRALQAKRLGMSSFAVVQSVAKEMILSILLLSAFVWIFGRTLVLATLERFQIGTPFNLPLTYVLATLVFGIFAISVALSMRKVRSALFRFLNTHRIPLSSFAVILLAVFAQFILIGQSAEILLKSFSQKVSSFENPLVLSCVVITSVIAGILVPGAPSGLGVREAASVFLLSSFVPSGEAFAFTAFFRIVSVASDLLVSGVSQLWTLSGRRKTARSDP